MKVNNYEGLDKTILIFITYTIVILAIGFSIGFYLAAVI
jgi:hypothetical protein